ncbi:RHS repeat-associated protein, partial [Knoellia remsis]
ETTTPDGSTSTTRFTESLGGDLSATINDDGGLSLSLANPHGDIVTTVDVPAAQTADTAATSITGWASYDEYGNQNNPAATDAVDGPLGYGWLGAKQRSTTSATAGLTLMGVRYYNAVRGFFTSLDPVPGGNENAYTYPNDPINMFDLDGRWSWRKAAKVAGWASLAVCIAASAGACAVAGAVAFGASFMSNRSDYRSRRISRGTFWRRTAVDAALSFVPTGRSLRLVGRHSAGPVARGFRGTAGAMWRGVRNRGTYSGKHRGGFSVRAGLRHSFNEFRRNWKVRPWRSARRVGYGIGAFYAGNRWG